MALAVVLGPRMRFADRGLKLISSMVSFSSCCAVYSKSTESKLICCRTVHVQPSLRRSCLNDKIKRKVSYINLCKAIARDLNSFQATCLFRVILDLSEG